MRVLIDDTLVTAEFATPMSAGWIESSIPVVVKADLRAGDLAAGDVALIPSGEISFLHETHLVIPDAAVIANGEGAIAMRAPVRPDEIAATPVRLYEASTTAELLARATLTPFYGIKPTTWHRDDAGDAQIVIVEGPAAVSEPEGGFSEDLARAWFILTGQPVVTHLLVAPKEISSDDLSTVRSLIEAIKNAAHEQRRELRRLVAERFEIDRDRLLNLLNGQRLQLDADDRRALLMLLQKGNKGSGFPYVWEIAYAD
jgi:predicted solute-binding protein